MGYRNYLGKIEKTVYNKEKMPDWEYRHKNIEEIHELGKYIEQALLNDLIYVDKLDDGDCEYSIIDIESIPKIVDFYAKKTLTYFNRIKNGEIDNMSTGLKRTATDFLNEKILDWSAPRFIYNTKREESNIVESWDYEYALFELLHIYKTFDTEKYYLTWTGH